MSDIENRRRQGFAELAGDVPRESRPEVDGFEHMYEPQIRRPNRQGKLNLRAVVDVLDSYGLDPIEELAKVLVDKEPARSRDGAPIIDPATGQPVMKPKLDIETHVKLLTELAQYTRPKLKAVEITNKTPELSDEQIERRLQALMDRNKGAK
jgi:hypothetical protein